MWRDGEGKRAPVPNCQIWGFVMGTGAIYAALRGSIASPGAEESRHGPEGVILPAARPVQEFGAIEARSYAAATRAGRAARPPRSNNIRRSNAVDRIVG
ncbi:hypothetical protein V1283_006737 [Bradyrhizobium sp. AZCC 2262]